MQLHEKQRGIIKNLKRFTILLAGRRFGKTVLAIEVMLFKAMSSDDARIAYIAPTYQSARDISWEKLKSRVQGVKGVEINESRLEMTVPNKSGGISKIVLRSWDNIETLRGQFFNYLVLDEVAMYRNFWSGWREVLRPTLTDKKGGALFISTPKGFNHFYDLYNEEGDEYISMHFTSYDNPYIDPEELDKAKEEITEDAFAQEYLADFRKQEGLVFKEFNRAVHTYTDAQVKTIDTAEYLGGVDFGYVHPAAVMHVKKDRRGVYYVTDELYQSGLTDAQIAEYVAAAGFEAVYPDPVQPQGIKELQNKGVNTRVVVKGPDSVRNGIQKMRELFKQGRLKINRKCKGLISELETYAYKENSEVPIKEGDDAIDSLRYIILMNEKARDYTNTEYPDYFIDTDEVENPAV